MFASNSSQVSGDVLYVEDVFSTWLYTGNGSTGQTITNNIDLLNKGGLVVTKSRSAAAGSVFIDSTRGLGFLLNSTSNIGQSATTAIGAFLSNGYTLPNNTSTVNTSGTTYVSWTFRKQAKFFDVVTYTGTGSAQNISHNLGSSPGCIIVKRTDTTSAWRVYNRGLAANQYLTFGSTTTASTSTTVWNNTAPTSTVFTVGTASETNASGGTFVAYLFAHDAGGFGASGNDNIISCGTFTTDAGGSVTVSLGYEPAWIMLKAVDVVGQDWAVADSLRGWYDNSTSSSTKKLAFNTTAAETNQSIIPLSSTGVFSQGNLSAGTYSYVAIRRGPMKTPTDPTKVFYPTTYTGNGSSQTITTTIRPDFVLLNWITGGLTETFDRVRGNELLYTSANASKDSSNQYISFDNNTGFILPSSVSYTNASSNSYTPESFTRAPSFVDVVSYVGTGSVLNVSHNLTIAPEMMWVKRRDTLGDWAVYHKDVGNTKWIKMNATSVPATSSNYWNNTTPTASVFTVGATGDVNASAGTYVAYLFGTCPGVSKVGSYTGNGTNQTINCGFSSGARLIMIKRTDAVGSWCLWDSSRGIVSGNDPYITLNNGAVGTTNDPVDTDNSGFIVNQDSLNLNVNAATYIFWAVA